MPLSRIGSRALFTKQIDDAHARGADRPRGALAQGSPDGAARGDRARGRGRAGRSERRAGGARAASRWETLPHGGMRGHEQPAAPRAAPPRAGRLHVVDLRGNVDTRLAKLDENDEWSAVILAAAGLVRLGLGDRIGQRLPPEVMLPAPGQGALAVTVREGDASAAAAARAVHHADTAMAVAAERAFLRTLEGGCQVPVAALATVPRAARLELHGRVVSLGGERAVEGIETGVGGERASRPRRSASRSRSGCSTTAPTRSWRGARAARARRAPSPDAGTVVVTASAGTFPGLVEALRRSRCRWRRCPLMEFAPPLDWRPVDQALDRTRRVRRGRGHVAAGRPRLCRTRSRRGGGPSVRRPPSPASGPAARRPPPRSGTAGCGEGHQPSTKSSARARRGGGARGRDAGGWSAGPVLFPCGDLRRDELPARLQDDGVDCRGRRVLPVGARERGRGARGGGAGEVLIVASPSVADLLARACPPGVRPMLLAVGPTTAAAARGSGWAPAAVSSRPDAAGLAKACVAPFPI